jgi:hypothetical protein
MFKVSNEEITQYGYMFEEYKYNIPVIYSSIEGQYESELFVNKYNNPDFALLITSFNFHYIAGRPNSIGVVDEINETIFQNFVVENNKDEAVVFCPTEEWHEVITCVFDKHNGLKDNRKLFSLNVDRFTKFIENLITPDCVIVKVIYEQEFNSTKPYPVARVYKDSLCVSHCSGFMLGKNHAEIDVGTEDEHQGKGYATLAAVALISELLDKGIVPDWCTWPYREVSQILAKKIGFEPQPDAKANIWLKQN